MKRKRGAATSTLIISVRAKPRSSVSSLEQESPDVWIARLRSPPVDGKANAELVELVARHFGRPKSAITVIAGASGRLKRVQVEGVEPGSASGA